MRHSWAHDKNLAAMHATQPLSQRLLSRLRQLLRGRPKILALPAAAYLSTDNYLHHYPFKKKDSAATLPNPAYKFQPGFTAQVELPVQPEALK